MPPRLETADKRNGEAEEEEEERDSEEEDDGPSPYRAEMEAKARVVQLRDKALGLWHKGERKLQHRQAG